jgi:FkbM family methyltransferase
MRLSGKPNIVVRRIDSEILESVVQLRTIAERLSRERVLKRTLRVQGNSVKLLVSPDSQLKYWKPWANAFDGDLVALAETFLDVSSRVWDVGANCGTFAHAAASIVRNGQIVAIEPDIWLAALIRRSARKYAPHTIDVVPAAVSNAVTLSRFMVAQRGRASSALEEAGGRDQMGGVREYQFVPTVTLDSLLESFEAPDFVKIDVEGAEAMVFAGAQTLLERHRPIVYAEIGPESANTSFELFRESGYRMFALELGELERTCHTNTLFLPGEDGKAIQRFQERFVQ